MCEESSRITWNEKQTAWLKVLESFHESKYLNSQAIADGHPT